MLVLKATGYSQNYAGIMAVSTSRKYPNDVMLNVMLNVMYYDVMSTLCISDS